MTKPITVRAGTIADAAATSVLSLHVFLDTYAADGIRPDVAREALTQYSVDAFQERFRDPRTSFVLAVRGTAIVGFAEVSEGRECSVATMTDRVELVRLYVQPTAQRHGIGGSLLRRAESLALEAGAEHLWLSAWSENVRARSFYEARGYHAIGTSSYTFEDQTYDNFVFARHVASDIEEGTP